MILRKTCCLLLASFLSFNLVKPIEAVDWQSLCIKGDLDAIRAILNVSSGDESPANELLSGGNRPLHVAAEYTSDEAGPEIIKLLLEHGADLTAKGLEGLPPLMLAVAYNSNAAVTEALLDAMNITRFDETVLIDANGRTPLHLAAAMSNNPEVLAVLLRSRAIRDKIRTKDKEDRTPLWLAASRADDQMVKLLLDAAIDQDQTSSDDSVAHKPKLDEFVDEPNREGITPLHVACERPEASVLELLVRAGADVNRRDSHRYTPLMLAVSAGADTDALQVLIDGGADLLAEDDQNRGALYLAAGGTNYDPAVVAFLLDALVSLDAKNANEVNTLDSSFVTPLMEACRSGNLPVAKILLERGADANLTDRNGYTALTFAALANAPREFFELLLKHGALIEGPGTTTHHVMTPLMAAVESKNVKSETLQTLIALGANPNYKTHQDITVLMLALAGASSATGKPEQLVQAQTRAVELVTTLIECGADPNIATWDGLTPLMIAARIIKSSPELFKTFLKAGADVNRQNNQGMTALMVAAATGNDTAVDCLIEAGADLSVQDIDGMTALCHAVQNSMAVTTTTDGGPSAFVTDALAQKILERLIAAGADVNVRMNRGMTPLMDAAVRGRSQALKTLLAAGSDVSMRDSVGWTPLHFAARDKTGTECLTLLLALEGNSKINADTGDNGGTTPLMVAAACDNAPAIEILLNAGADMMLTDRTGRDALSYARMRNSRECLPVLEARRNADSKANK